VCELPALICVKPDLYVALSFWSDPVANTARGFGRLDEPLINSVVPIPS
jgi:hypothetical protein